MTQRLALFGAGVLALCCGAHVLALVAALGVVGTGAAVLSPGSWSIAFFGGVIATLALARRLLRGGTSLASCGPLGDDPARSTKEAPRR